MANRYVIPGGGGGGPGTSWSNAYLGTAGINWAAVNAGDTLWFAGGPYGAFAPGKSGVTIKRATAANPECTGAAGWSAGYDAQVTFTFTTYAPGASAFWVDNIDNLTIDGQVPNGFKVTLPSVTGVDVNTTTATPMWGIRSVGNNNTYRCIEVVGPSSITAHAGIGASNGGASSRKTGLTVQNCYFHSLGAGMFIGQTDNMLIEGNTIEHTFGNGPNHDNGIYFYSTSHGILRNNILRDFGAIGFYWCSLDGDDDWQIYGNLCHNPPGPGHGQAMDLDPSGGSRYGPNWLFYHNTFVNCLVGIRGSGRLGASTTGGQVKNNIFWNVGYDWGGLPHDYNFSDVNLGEVNGVANGTDPFVNLAGGDYRISSTVSPTLPRNKGYALGAPYNVDKYGATRGADGGWDIGAYEYAGASLTAVQQNRQGIWNVLAAVSAAHQGVWDVRSYVAGLRTALWNVLAGLPPDTQVSATRTASWNVSGVAIAGRQALWNVQATVQRDHAGVWNVEISGTTTPQASRVGRVFLVYELFGDFATPPGADQLF